MGLAAHAQNDQHIMELSQAVNVQVENSQSEVIGDPGDSSVDHGEEQAFGIATLWDKER